MITTKHVEQAEAQVAEARQRAATLRKHGASDAEDMVQRAVVRAVELKENKARQDAALKVRKAAEREHTADLKAIGASLDDSSGEVSKALRDAAQTLVKLVAAVRSHNATVSAAHARLAALGLPIGDDDVATYDTGHGRAGQLSVNGRVWGQLPVDLMIQQAAAEVIGKEFGPKHPAAQVRDIRAHSLRRGASRTFVQPLNAG